MAALERRGARHTQPAGRADFGSTRCMNRGVCTVGKPAACVFKAFRICKGLALPPANILHLQVAASWNGAEVIGMTNRTPGLLRERRRPEKRQGMAPQRRTRRSGRSGRDLRRRRT